MADMTQQPFAGPRRFLTADDVATRIAEAGSGVLALAANEVLTPAAADAVDRLNVHVTRTVDAIPVGIPKVTVPSTMDETMASLTHAKPTGRATVGAVGLVVERPTTQVEALLGSLRFDGTTFVDSNVSECWIVNLEALADAMNTGPLSAGVLIAPHAADAAVVAGKMKGIRPVQATSDAAVTASVRHYDANLLVIGHRDCGFGEMRAMIRTFTAARTGLVNADILKAIARHEGA
jgi:ribose 5-phosphate isomerase RpiB